MQFTRRDWRNRNKIKTSNGSMWLTIPVEVKGKYFQKINETNASSRRWAADHWKSICLNYSKSKYFKDYKNIFEPLYLNVNTNNLSEINMMFITEICSILNISTQINKSSEYTLIQGKTERLIQLCKQTGSNIYYSGPSAKNYLDEYLLQVENIEVKYIDFSGYKQYDQLYGEFDHYVSIIDLIFNEGPQCKKFMKSFN
jgi:hypothetical protein